MIDFIEIIKEFGLSPEEILLIRKAIPKIVQNCIDSVSSNDEEDIKEIPEVADLLIGRPELEQAFETILERVNDRIMNVLEEFTKAKRDLNKLLEN